MKYYIVIFMPQIGKVGETLLLSFGRCKMLLKLNHVNIQSFSVQTSVPEAFLTVSICVQMVIENVGEGLFKFVQELSGFLAFLGTFSVPLYLMYMMQLGLMHHDDQSPVMVCWLHREWPQRLLSKVKNVSGRIGLFVKCFNWVIYVLYFFH